jgi:hypothetical protein
LCSIENFRPLEDLGYNFAHSSSRVDSDLAEPNGLSHRTRKHVDGAPIAAIALGSDHGSQLIASYKEAPSEVDQALIQSLSTAIYAHSQRLRHTFQEWLKSSSNATLPKANFVVSRVYTIHACISPLRSLVPRVSLLTPPSISCRSCRLFSCLQSGARALKVDLSDAQADALFARFDVDGDGEITYSEFVRMLASK